MGATALTLASCVNPADNQAQPAVVVAQGRVPIVRVSTDGTACRAAWTGEFDQTERPVDTTRLIEAAGEYLTRKERERVQADPRELEVQVSAAPDVPYRCIAAAAFSMNRTGFGLIRFTVEGRPGPPLLVSVPNVCDGGRRFYGAMDRPTVRLTFADGGRLRWDGATVMPEQLRNRLHRALGQIPVPFFEFRPAPDTRFEHVVRMTEQLRAAGMRFDDPDASRNVLSGPEDVRWITEDFASELGRWQRSTDPAP